MGQPVAADDLPANVVPEHDLPEGKYSPETLKAMASIKDWGTGFPNIAYKAGGAVTDLFSKIPALRGTPAAAAGYATDVGIQAIPALFGGKLAQESGAPELLKEGGRKLMQSAVKPTISDLRSGDAANAIETMLQQGYSPTKGGVEAMKEKIAQLGDEIKQVIADSPATVNKNAVANRLNTALSKFSQQVNPQSDLKAIESAWTEFLNHPLLAGNSEIPVQVAQALKQGTYQQLGDKPYGELSGAATEAQKQLARGLKEEISAAVPAVAPLNKAQGELLNAKDIAERRALMEGNKNPIGLGILNPKSILFWLADRNAAIKALAARGLYSGSEAIPFSAGTGLGALLGAQAGKPEGALEATLRKYNQKQ